MTVVYRGVSTANSANNTATIALAQDIPSLADGDYMLMALYANSNEATPPQPPGGWTLLESAASGTFFVEVWGKIAASEGASYTITKNTGSKVYGGVLLAFRSDAALTLYRDAHAAQANTSSANRTCPGVVTTVASAGLACFFAAGSNLSSTPPGDMTERLDTMLSLGVRAYAMTSILTVAGATGDKVATGTAMATRAATVAIGELPAGRNGALSVTLDAMTMAATGTVAVKGAASITIGAVTLSATGNVGSTAILGAASITLGAVSLAAAAGTVGPLAPRNLTATPISGSRIDLTWDDDDTAAASYSVERSLNGTTGWAEIFVATDKSYSDVGLAQNTTYYYRVRAIKA